MVLETGVQFNVKTQKMVLDAALLKVRIKCKVEQSREWSSTPPLHLSIVAIEKGAFGSPTTLQPQPIGWQYKLIGNLYFFQFS